MTTDSPIDSLYLMGARRSDTETLLAALLGGTAARKRQIAARLLWTFGSVEALAQAGTGLLKELDVGRAEAARLLACFELGRRRWDRPPAIATVREPRDAYRCLAPELVTQDEERFAVLVLDAGGRPLTIKTVGQGSIDHCPIDLREVFRPAVEYRGTSVVVAHNHPSGDPTPSPEDIALTRRLQAACKVLGLSLLDHLVMAGGSPEAEVFVSLAEAGLLKREIIEGRR